MIFAPISSSFPTINVNRNIHYKSSDGKYFYFVVRICFHYFYDIFFNSRINFFFFQKLNDFEFSNSRVTKKATARKIFLH